MSTSRALRLTMWLASTVARASVGSSFAAGAEASPSVPVHPEREAFFGDLHLHTTYSLDSYLGFGTRLGPEDAYRFAQGKTVTWQGEPVRRAKPLDFLAVTDHAEWLGVINALEESSGALAETPLARKLRSGDRRSIWADISGWPAYAKIPSDVPIKDILQSTWQRIIDAANRHYRPGTFTTFIGYEWTVNFAKAGEHYHLHRNVIFRGDSAPAPFSAVDSDQPEDLWAYLENARKHGYEALAIPHNPNLSNGVVFDWTGSERRPIDQAYAEMRAANEPLIEIVQHKGSSEVHPALAPNDEFADFELFKSGQLEGSYFRDGLGRGLLLQGQAGGVNPFKYGVAGGSDFHTGLSESAENGFAGFAGWWGPVNLDKPNEDPEARLRPLIGEDAKKLADHMQLMTSTSSAGLTGVWAERNTRESIYAGFRRKETFATSGTRIQVRFFGAWDFAPELLKSRDWVKSAYKAGVPMGGDLPSRASAKKAPQFLLWASKDPDGANLDRLQIVKVWLEGGKHVEKVYDVAWSDGRVPDSKTGKVPPVGSTIDLGQASYTNKIGAVALSARWQDPDFDPKTPAVYYLRMLEIPTPRWSTLVAVKLGKRLPQGVPATIQERAWSSPIWFTPTNSL